jgi:hypothetical protein
MIGLTQPIDSATSADRYRVWIVRFENWQPGDWCELPPHGQVVELAEADCLTSAQADSFRQGFNRAMLGQSAGLWAIAVPVVVRYEGDLQLGMEIANSGID